MDGVADRPAKSAMDAKKGLGSNLVVSLLGAHMVNDNWKSQGPSYQLPARDVGFRLLGRRFSANKQSVSIKIFDPAQILAGSQPVIYSSRSLDLLRPWLGRTSQRYYDSVLTELRTNLTAASGNQVPPFSFAPPHNSSTRSLQITPNRPRGSCFVTALQVAPCPRGH